MFRIEWHLEKVVVWCNHELCSTLYPDGGPMPWDEPQLVWALLGPRLVIVSSNLYKVFIYIISLLAAFNEHTQTYHSKYDFHCRAEWSTEIVSIDEWHSTETKVPELSTHRDVLFQIWFVEPKFVKSLKKINYLSTLLTLGHDRDGW